MRHGDDFLARLGLRGDAPADARSIRRAYARELKQVDQERDAPGFQALREAYEAALYWAEQQLQLQLLQADADARAPAQEQAQEQEHSGKPDFGVPRVPVQLGAAALERTSAAMPQQDTRAHADSAVDWPSGLQPDLQADSKADSKADSQADSQADPQAWADAVFRQSLVSCAILAQGPQSRDHAVWCDMLRRCLNDARLDNMAARSLFEQHLADLLARGWKRGHETLLVAAVDVFDWSNDRRRLLRFGQAGARIDQAIDERHMFDAQPEGEREAQRALVERLRETRPPTPEELRRDRFHFERMRARYPAMMALLVGEANLARWAGPYQHMPRSTAFTVDESVLAQAALKPGKPRGHYAKWLLALCFAIGLLWLLFDAAAPDVMPPAMPASGQVSVAGLPLSQASIRDIDNHIGYTPQYPKVGDQRRVQYQVFLDEQFKVIMVHKTVASGDLKFDEAVSRAIRRAGPFPQGTARVFKLSYPIAVTATGTGTWSP